MRPFFKKAFTLLEICIAIALLSMIGAVLGWQVKGMLAVHTFHKSLDHFLVELKHLQIVAMTHRADLVVSLIKTEKGYEYRVHTDEPIAQLHMKKDKFKAVEKITQLGIESLQIDLSIYSSGIIEPKGKKDNLVFVYKNRSVELDLSHPLKIALCRKRSAENI